MLGTGKRENATTVAAPPKLGTKIKVLKLAAARRETLMTLSFLCEGAYVESATATIRFQGELGQGWRSWPQAALYWLPEIVIHDLQVETVRTDTKGPWRPFFLRLKYLNVEHHETLRKLIPAVDPRSHDGSHRCLKA